MVLFSIGFFLGLLISVYCFPVLTSTFSCEIESYEFKGRLGNAQSMVFPSTVGEFSAVSSSNLLIPQHIPIEVPEVSNILPGRIFSKEISTLEDIVQSCSLIMKSQHNQNRPHPSYLQPQVAPEQSHAAQQCASDGPSSGNIEDILPSSKRLKMEYKNGSVQLLAPSVVQHCAPEGLSYLQHQSESPQSINSEDTVQSCSRMIKSQHNQKRPLCPYLRPQVPPEQSHGAQEYASDGPSSGNIEDIPPSSKRLKMENINENSHLLAPSVVQPCAPKGLSYLQQQSKSPVSINSEVTHVEIEPAKNSIQDSTGISDVRKCDSDNINKLDSESAPLPSVGVFICHQMEQLDPTSTSEIIDNVKKVPRGMGSKSLSLLSEELSVEFKEGEVRTEFIQTEPIPDSDLKEVIKPQNPETKGALLTEIFTEEQIKEHLSSLGQSIDQVVIFPFTVIAFFKFLQEFQLIYICLGLH